MTFFKRKINKKSDLQKFRGSFSFIGFLDETLPDEVVEDLREILGLLQVRGRLRGDHENRSHRVDLRIGRSSLGHFDCGDAQTPDVRFRVVANLLDDLGSHPKWSTDYGISLRHRVLNKDFRK